ncbi:bifunctional diguanylate cyclase/phosphodiesterase [Mariprofundus sp. EBB-1]|uniref:bifunctional diguanylate cyclase/phosphodiesterase n=1 Tax=Mariprofundus sp. EBB-1 TaxID=2650971 RepID=UPI00137A7C4A|nr:bifunctional diguanylate cyclase/phosphodiesterase [Mariprofundus sp. EBB-1]
MQALQLSKDDMGDKSQQLKEELLGIIDRQDINTLFQPVFDLGDHSIFAYEALSRGPVDSELFNPERLFEIAYHHQLASELDYLCRRKAVENFVNRNISGKLALNICPSVLVNMNFRSGRTLQMLQEVGLSSDRVILELTEHQQTDIASLKQAVNYYRDLGFSIAMDDLSAGYSNLRLLAELQPDYLKLDKFFVSGVKADCVEAEFVKLITDLAARVGCKVIAEGVESADDLMFIQRMDIAFGQGYLLGMPQQEAIEHIPDVLLETSDKLLLNSGLAANSNIDARIQCNIERIGSLQLDRTDACFATDKLTSVLNTFQSNPELLALPVLENGKVVGAIIRDALLNEFSKPYAHSLYNRAPVSKLMLKDPLIVQVEDSLSDASQMATSRSYNLVYCPIIVCDGERYIGMLSIRKLLEKITQTQVVHALHSNPLTSLPGNVRIASEIQERIDKKATFVLSYFDLDNFKAFNDKYGFERGDKMICLVAELLRKTALKKDFVGHIGGDDFVMILSGAEWEQRVWSMLQSFTEKSQLLYNDHERELGFIESTDRLGHIREFAMASLSVSATICSPGKFKSHLEASEVIATIKHESKKLEGNSMIVDRRKC